MLAVTLLLAAFLQDGIEPTLLPELKTGPGLAFHFPGDRGLETDPRVILFENFEDADLKKRWSELKSFPGTIDLVGDAHAGTKAARITATPAQDTGGHLYKMLEPGHEKLYLRFYVKFPADHGYVHHFVHLVGYRPPTRWPQGGAGERPKGDERFSTGIDLFGDWGKHKPPGRWMFYSYWCEMKGSPDGKYWGNAPKGAPDVLARTGTWTCVEVMLRCNAPGKADGEQALWIDGNPAGRWTGYRWRTDAALNVNGVWILYYITENAARQNKAQSRASEHVFFDDIVAATEYIGPMADRTPGSGR